MNQSLHGVRVLDFSRLLPGPLASLVLADMGAQVDKVEDPFGGDYLRHMPPQVSGQNATFLNLNRGKRSMVLNLKRPQAAEAVLRMVKHYDVLLEQFRPGVLARLGLSHAQLQQANPRLIVASISGYGANSPLSHRAGHDLNYLARSGLLGLTGPSKHPPQPPGYQLADVAGGMWAVIAILGALRDQERTGVGAIIDIAMCDSTVPFAAIQLGALGFGTPIQRGNEVLTGAIAPYNTYETKDGQYVAIAALEPKFWQAFCAGVNLESSMSDMVPGSHQIPLKARMAAIFRSKTRSEWITFSNQFDCCLEPVLAPEELLEDEHLKARNVLSSRTFENGQYVQTKLPVGTPSELPAPSMAEHTTLILSECGFSEEEINEMRHSGVAS